MTNEELRALIYSRAASDQTFAALLAVRDDTAMAEALSQGRTKVVSTVGGYGTVVAVCGGATMNKLKTIAESGVNADFTWGYQALLDRCFDFGLAKVIAGWDALTQIPNGLTQDEADLLKAVPVVPDPVLWWQVNAALGEA